MYGLCYCNNFRGNKGFFAMGNIDGDFDTGMPDGEFPADLNNVKNNLFSVQASIVTLSPSVSR